MGRFAVAAVFLIEAAVAGAEPTAAPAASIREVVYFGPAGPVRIRFHLAIDGRSPDALWADAIESLFAFRDKNSDGFFDAAERAPFVVPTRGGRDIELPFGGPAVQPLRLTFNTKDERISKAAFAEAVRSAGQAPVALRVVPGRTDSRQLSAALFRHLDQNSDGRLSQDELKAARERLETLDIDEDEFVTTFELLGRGAGPNVGRVPQITGTRPAEEPVDSSKELVFLTADGTQAVKQLLAARGAAKATSLRPAEFGADAKTFAALDQDGNGVLDTTELTAWLSRPPDLTVTVSFDAAGNRLSVLPADKKGAMTAVLPGGRFLFEPPSGTSAKEWSQAVNALAAQFQELAKKSMFVERKQLENQLLGLAFYDFADRNADGKVDAAGVAAAIKALSPVARCRVDVSFGDLGNGLFELLDRNGDGRLSPREMVEAAAVLKSFAGRDGRVGPKDLVRQFHVRIAVESIPVGVLLPPRPISMMDPDRPAAVPSWFTKMDRNGDGDVSLREFVGPIELFRKLDRDGDGLISAAEAMTAK